MIDFSTMVTFGAAFTVFAASPGPDNVTIFSKTISSGPAYGIAYGTGVVVSIICFVILATAGFTAANEFLSTNLSLLQYVGAAYLIYMGVMTWKSAPKPKPKTLSGGIYRMFMTGFALNISNPKMTLFYLALLPGISGARAYSLFDTFLIISVVVLVEIIVIGGHVLFAHSAKTALSTPNSIRIINRVSGSMMVGAGFFIAARS
jgi:threonine/homoserine/homoserine lactone efflux protein